MTELKAPKPPRKPSTKGLPPTAPSAAPAVAVANYSDKRGEGETVAMNLRKPSAWRKKVQQYCLDHDLSWTDLAEKAVEEYMANHK